MQDPLLLQLFDAFSFLYFGIAALVQPFFKKEFERYGLAGYRTLTGWLQIIAALGMMLGLRFVVFAFVSAAGLTLLMFLGFCVRLKIGDGFIKSFPSFFYCALNAFLTWQLFDFF
jgi:hypothetical protein